MPEPPMMPRTAFVMLTPPIGLSYASFIGLLKWEGRRKSRRLRGAQLACDHALQGRDRLEILRRDLVLRDGEIELGFDAEHEVDHVHRGQPDVDQRCVRRHFGHKRILLEDSLHQGYDPIPNVGIKTWHCRPHHSRSKRRYNRSI